MRDLVKDVLIPWLNAFRFSTNIMDNWILARVSSLIKFVKSEMEGYRLYTVVPRLLNMIEELTNWYIRFNRRRLKVIFFFFFWKMDTKDVPGRLWQRRFAGCLEYPL